MKRKSILCSLLLIPLLGGCNSTKEISMEEALERLFSFHDQLLLEETPRKYTVKSAYKNSLKYDDIVIENAKITLLLDEEKSFYQVHLEGENEGQAFFSESYLVVRNDSELWELLWESGQGKEKQTKIRREIKGRTFQESVQSALSEKERLFHDAPKEVIDTIESLKEREESSFKGVYECKNEDDLSVALSYDVEGITTDVSYSFIAHKLDSFETSEQNTKILWNECDAIAPQFKDYALVE